MPVTYQHARQLIGQPVCAHCTGGIKHYGILRGVTRDGVWLAPLPGRTAVVAGESKQTKAVTADQPTQTKGEHVYSPFGFGGFFLPFLALLALTPLLAAPFW